MSPKPESTELLDHVIGIINPVLSERIASPHAVVKTTKHEGGISERSATVNSGDIQLVVHSIFHEAAKTFPTLSTVMVENNTNGGRIVYNLLPTGASLYMCLTDATVNIVKTGEPGTLALITLGNITEDLVPDLAKEIIGI